MGLGLDGMQKMNGAINVDFMTEEEIHQKLEAGYKDMESGKVREASIVWYKANDRTSNRLCKKATALGFYKQYRVSAELGSQIAGMMEKEFIDYLEENGVSVWK